jgi:hypothetical protein
MNTVLKVLEGYGAAVGEQKTNSQDLKEIMHGAKYIIPGSIVQNVADYASPRYFGAASVGAWGWTEGQKSKNYIMAKVKPT